MFEEETTDDLNEYKKQLGLVGLHLMQIADRSENSYDDYFDNIASERRDTRSLVRYDETDEDFMQSYDDSEHGYNSIVDYLSDTTIDVRITNAFSDLIEPLVERLDMSSDEYEEREIGRHHEIGMYLDKMLTGILNLDARDAENRGIFLAMKEFYRHPWLYIGRGMVGAITGTVKAGFGVLFGRNEKKTDTDRIVDAIDRQTEWHMNKGIDQGKGFFERLKRQGVLGMAVRGAANLGLKAAGVDRNLAQDREDDASRGITRQGDGVRGWLSSKIYGSDIVKKGRNQNVQPTTVIFPTNTTIDVRDKSLLDIFIDMYNDSLQLERDDYVIQVKSLQELYRLSSIMGGVNPIDFNSIEIDSKCGEDCVGDAFRDFTKQDGRWKKKAFDFENSAFSFEKHQWAKEDKRHTDSILRDREKEAFDVEMSELVKDQKSGIYEVAKHAKHTRDEVRKSRMQAMWGSLLSFGSKILSGVGSLVLAGAGLAAALLPLKSIGSLLSGLGSKIVSGFSAAIAALMAKTGLGDAIDGVDTPEGENKKNGKKGKSGGLGGKNLKNILSPRNLTIGGLTATGLMVGASNVVDPDSKVGGSIDILGQIATGASLGAIAGAPFAGVGAIPGAIVGGIGGLGTGLYSNWETMFGGAEETSKPDTKQAVQDDKTKPQSMIQSTIPTTAPRKPAVDVTQPDILQMPPSKTEDVTKFAPTNPQSSDMEFLKNLTVSGIAATAGVVTSGVEYLKDGFTEKDAKFSDLVGTTKSGVDSTVATTSNGINYLKDSFVEKDTKFGELVGVTKSAVESTAITAVNGVNLVTDEMKPMTAEVRALASAAKNKSVDFGRDVVEFSNKQVQEFAPKFEAIQQNISMQADAIKEVYEGMKKQAEETINELREGNKTGKEMVALLKGILQNSATETPEASSPFSGVTDGGFLRNIIGR